jgi:serine protease Do
MIGRELKNTESNTWINYAIPIGELSEAIASIREGRMRSTEPLRAENASTGYTALDFGIILVPDSLYRTPAYIDQIIPDSPAAGLGLTPDDLIVFVNDQLVHSIRSLNEHLGRLQAEDDLTIVVRRGKQLVPVQLVVPRKQTP